VQSYRQKLGQPVFLIKPAPPLTREQLRALVQETYKNPGAQVFGKKQVICDEIIPNLFLGNRSCGDRWLTQLLQAEDKEDKEKKPGEIAILRCTLHPLSPEAGAYAKSLTEKQLLKILSIGILYDGDMSQHFENGFNFIEAALQKGRKILVHCDGGDTRSPVIIAAYLIRKYGLTATEALNHIQNKHSPLNIEPDFTSHLEKYANTPRQNLMREFLEKHHASYRAGCCHGFFSVTNLRMYTQDQKGFDKGLDVDSIITHARQPTFFGNKNRTRQILEEMKVMDENGNLINLEFKAIK
jgi:hypothetical protein